MKIETYIKNFKLLPSEEQYRLQTEYAIQERERLKKLNVSDELVEERRLDLSRFLNEQFDQQNWYWGLNNFDKEKLSVSGVYFLGAMINDILITGYIGEAENIYKRWLTHANSIYKKANNQQRIHRKLKSLLKKELIRESDICFIKLKQVDNHLDRIFAETNYILFTKSSVLMMNNKNIPYLKLCPLCDGVLGAKNKIVFENNHFTTIALIKCKNKTCKFIKTL